MVFFHFSFSGSIFFAMADFDAAQDTQNAPNDRDIVTFLEQNVQYLINQIQQLQNQPQPPLPPRPNLNLPTPPQFFWSSYRASSFQAKTSSLPCRQPIYLS